MQLERLRAELGAAIVGADTPLAAADRLCVACVELLDVDGASVSVVRNRSSQGTFGSSGPTSRQVDELQFTFGEGPCFDSVASGQPVLAPDLDDKGEQRWPALRSAMVEHGISAVFALPVAVESTYVGALDLFRGRSGELSDRQLSGSLWAAELAARPLLELMTADVDWEAIADSEQGWAQLSSLERVEVYQATGMIMAALDTAESKALVRLRGYAFAQGKTASEVAWAIVERRLAPTLPAWPTISGAGTDHEATGA